jgi:hypothetical protein
MSQMLSRAGPIKARGKGAMEGLRHERAALTESAEEIAEERIFWVSI